MAWLAILSAAASLGPWALKPGALGSGRRCSSPILHFRQRVYRSFNGLLVPLTFRGQFLIDLMPQTVQMRRLAGAVAAQVTDK